MEYPQIYFTSTNSQDGIGMTEVGSIGQFPIFLIGTSDKSINQSEAAKKMSEDLTRRFSGDV